MRMFMRTKLRVESSTGLLLHEDMLCEDRQTESRRRLNRVAAEIVRFGHVLIICVRASCSEVQRQLSAN